MQLPSSVKRNTSGKLPSLPNKTQMHKIRSQSLFKIHQISHSPQKKHSHFGNQTKTNHFKTQQSPQKQQKYPIYPGIHKQSKKMITQPTQPKGKMKIRINQLGDMSQLTQIHMLKSMMKSHIQHIPHPIAMHRGAMDNKKQEAVLGQDNISHVTAAKWMIFKLDYIKKANQTKSNSQPVLKSHEYEVIKGYKYKKLHQMDVSSMVNRMLMFLVVKQLLSTYFLNASQVQLMVLPTSSSFTGVSRETFSPMVLLPVQSMVTCEDMLYAIGMTAAENCTAVLMECMGAWVRAKQANRYYSCWDIKETDRQANINKFLQLMKKQADKIGLKNTTIGVSNTIGVHLTSSVQDIGILASRVLPLPFFQLYTTPARKQIRPRIISSEGIEQYPVRLLSNSNRILSAGINCITGISSGCSFIGLFSGEDQTQFGVVVMSSATKQQRWRDCQRLISWCRVHSI